jgi:hypothetical protein
MKVADYTIRPLKFDADLVQRVMARRRKDESIAQVAKALKIGTGRAAMAELIGSNERVKIEDPAKLARAVVKDRRNKHASWGLLAARSGITEGTARSAFEAATGKPFTALDYRRNGEEA